MGAGASSMDGLETMLTATFLLGHALTRAFPDIYTIDDFDASPAKKRRDEAKRKSAMQHGHPQIRALVMTKDGQLRPMKLNGAGTLSPLDENAAVDGEDADLPALEDGTDEDADDTLAPDKHLVVQYQGHSVTLALDGLDKPNDDGWTPLHAAAHQHTGAEALKLMVAVVTKRNGNLNRKTTRGPGSFVSNCTPLHLASAYGIKSSVATLVEAGADVNAKNSIGWTPLYEALHRGYVDVVEILIKAGAETNAVIPPCYASPQHGQYPLAHACRQGHDKVAKLLLSNSEISQRKDQQNDFGWTALHECAFYNRAECVKLLLVYGCDGSLRTKRGLRAIDMTLSEEVQNLLLELVPEEERDTIVEKGKEARAKAKQQEQQQNQLRAHAARRGGQPSESKEAVLGERNGMHAAQNLVRDADDDDDDDSSCSDSGSDDGSEDDTSPTTNASAALHDQTNKKVSEGKQSDSYRLLGDLPDLAGGGAQQHKSKHGSSSTGNSKTRRGKKKGKRRSKQGTAGRVATPEKGVPSAFCCSLTGKLMSDPVRTPFGNHCYERDAVERWLKEQGNLDPVTGMPLATCELILDHPLRIQINDWQLQESLKGGGSSSGEQPDLCPKETAPMHAGKASKLKDAMGVSRSELDTSNDTTIPTGGGGGDDLYDF